MLLGFAAKAAVCALAIGVVVGGVMAGPGAQAGPCASDHLPTVRDKPGGFPQRLAVLVPYGPGGGSGQLARAMGQAVEELTGVPVAIDYVPGGSGAKGMAAYMALPADGYTVLEHVDDAASAHALDASKPNPAEDLIPLVTAQVTFSQIYISAVETRFSDWNSLVAHLKKSARAARIANVSNAGSMERVNLRLIAHAAGIEIEPIGFDSGPVWSADAGAAVDALFEQPGDVRDYVESGKFRAILTLLPDRVAAFPDTPAMKDVGLDFEPLMRYRGFYVKKGVPEERLQWLQWAFQKAYCQDSFRRFNEEKYMHLIESFRDTEGSIRLITSTIETYRRVYRELGFKPR